MIHYQLRCAEGHGFDGWFRDSAGFEQQAARGLVACPECGGTQVNRALMAPALGKKSNRTLDAAPNPPEPQQAPAETVPVKPEAAKPGPEKTAVAMPDQLRAALQRLRAAVERNSDYVGPDFANEARRIHRGETDHRSIYGESTPDEAAALADEGIDVTRIPWVPRADG